MAHHAHETRAHRDAGKHASFALSKSASLSTYTWQMPSAWPMTGILVEFWMDCTI